MDAVTTYIHQRDPVTSAIMSQLHQALMDNPGVVAKIRYKVPFYFRKSWFCYVNPLKKQGVELAFIRGRELSNSEGILQAKNRKMVHGVELLDPAKIPWPQIQSVIQEALLLDESKPYSIRQK